ncbi:MAG: PAS domain S-box protein [Archangiaceae bacterium]|nr:PAS domain S-box protein [Archangiaceae bacterium]
MKSDSPANLVPFPVTGPAADAFRAFFETVDGPAALCDAQMTVLTANAAFEALCGARDISGKPLSELMAQVPEAPAEGRTEVVDVRTEGGHPVTLSFSRRGATVAVLARQMPQDMLSAAGRALIEHGRVEQRLLELGRQVALSMSEEELVATVARGVKGLFPGRTFCVRITDPRTCVLTSLYAEGRMRDGVRDTLVIKRSAAEKTHLSTSGLPTDRVKVVAGDRPLLFNGSVRGISAPLVASGQLFGVVDVEYPEGMSADLVSDERVLIQLANQVSVAVRNAKLIDELIFVRKYLEELLEHANALILVANRDRKVVVFNKAMMLLTGLSKSEVLGQDLLEFVPESERLKVMRVMSSSLRGEAVSSFETLLKASNGNEIRVAFSSSSVLTQTGEVEGVIAIGQDLTRMKELEKRVVQAEKLTSLGQLAASVVHEINNPMTAVSAYAEALLSRARTQPAPDPADVEKFKKIVDNSERVLRFTRDLVSYARPPQDKATEVDLNAAVEQAIGFCEHVLSKHGVKLERDLQPVPAFFAVKQNLSQVVVNLITNACHAMPRGGQISVRTRADDGTAVITVSDDGAGISPEVRARIFEPFFTTKPDGKGTGLGLSIVQGIVENHGGTIEVDSETGRGTTFTIRLPMVTG